MHKYTKEVRAIKTIRKDRETNDHEKKLREEINILKEMVRSAINPRIILT